MVDFFKLELLELQKLREMSADTSRTAVTCGSEPSLAKLAFRVRFVLNNQ